MVEAQFADEGGEPPMTAALRKGGTDALLRESGEGDKRLALEIRIEEELLALDKVTEIGEKVGIR